ncbi:malate dehydrogenase, mitochondrial isoform X1 [Leptinotarsa decemlineata]|uniref:malate dehydrogenase, mitochondrial isoform X1 n=1 Tax=Leptinotarsa decemlineata TaxID=7539 RepID=UPI003D306893
MIAPTVSDIFKKTAKSLFYVDIRHCSNSFRQKGYVVTVLDAYCKIGRYIALLLKQNPFIGELRLYDKNNNICAVAEDLSHIDTRTKIKSFGGKAVLKHAITDADIVVAVGGCKESHKETAKQLFEKNVDDVRMAALNMIEFNPKGVFCVSKPPIEGLVPVITEEYKKAGLYDSRKIIGITNVTSMRANSQVAAATGRGASEIVCPVVGGSSTNCVVAVLSQVRPKELDLKCPGSVQQLIGNSEDDVLKLYADCGTVCLSPALAVSRFINTLLKAFKGETNCVECAFVRQTGHIGQFLPYMTSIVRLGRHGIMSSHMPKISGDEAALLKKAAIIIREHIRMGESFVTGEVVPPTEDTPAPAVSETTAEKSLRTVQKHV